VKRTITGLVIVAIAIALVPQSASALVDLGWTSISPDGQWVAELTAIPAKTLGELAVTLTMRHARNGKSWVVLREKGWDEYYGPPQVVTWSPDSTSLYFRASSLGGCGGCDFLISAGAGGRLSRADLRTRTVRVMSSDTSEIARSPDGQSIALTDAGKRRLSILSIRTGRVRHFGLKLGAVDDLDRQLGGTLWSPDGRYIALTYATASCAGDGATTIAVVDLHNGAQRIFPQSINMPWATLEWGTRYGLTVGYFARRHKSGGVVHGTLSPRDGAITSTYWW
jgi:WD40 repeat protein